MLHENDQKVEIFVFSRKFQKWEFENLKFPYGANIQVMSFRSMQELPYFPYTVSWTRKLHSEQAKTLKTAGQEKKNIC